MNATLQTDSVYYQSTIRTVLVRRIATLLRTNGIRVSTSHAGERWATVAAHAVPSHIKAECDRLWRS